MKTRGWIGSTLLTACGAMVIVLAASALVFAQSKGQKSQGDTRSLMSKKAPAFEMQTLDGQTVSLESLKGNVVVLDFWATWCGPCVAAMPHLQEMANNTELTEKGLKVLAVNMTTWKPETEQKAKEFIAQNSYTFTVSLDRDGSVGKAYKVQGIPTQVVIGRDGMIKKVFVGDGGEQLNQAVEVALKAKAPVMRGPATQPTSPG